MADDAPPALLDRCIEGLLSRGHDHDVIQTLFVPGRIEILGKHTDYCGGRSATCAIDRGFNIAFVASDESRLSMTSLELGETCDFPLSPQLEPLIGTWANYPMSVARRLSANFAGPLRGAEVVFASTLPQASGMSSSSVFVVATFLVLDAANGFLRRPEAQTTITDPFELADYLGTLENGQSYRSLAGDRGVGTFGGSEDHTAITLGRAGRIGVYGYAPTRFEREVALPPDHMLLVASSGVLAEKTGAARGRYNQASLLARELVGLWNEDADEPSLSLAAALRSGDGALDHLQQIIRAAVADGGHRGALLRRLDHFHSESEQILPAAMDALAAGALPTFGRHVDESQRLAEQLLENQVPETNHLARTARRLGAVAASAFGAGFGGSAWALVPQAGAETFKAAWAEDYALVFPEAARRSHFFTTVPSQGTHR